MRKGKTSGAGIKVKSKEFMVVGCPSCENLQLTTSKKAIRCKYCGRITSMNKLKVFYSSNSYKDALKALYQMRGES